MFSSKVLLALCIVSVFVSVRCDIEFSRTITAIGEDGTLDLELQGDSGDECASEDEYGSNDCKFDWGETITGSFAGTLGNPIEEGSTLNVNLKVNKVISWKFSCAACGANCSTTVPVVNEPVNFAMPDCPLPAGVIDVPLEAALPDSSPLPAGKVTAVGSIGVKDAAGNDVLAMDVDIYVK